MWRGHWTVAEHNAGGQLAVQVLVSFPFLDPWFLLRFLRQSLLSHRREKTPALLRGLLVAEQAAQHVEDGLLRVASRGEEC